jgi:diguanylate cyclase (GGDEF)-like protein
VRRLSLLSKFAVVSLALIAVLGFVLSRNLASQVRSRALEGARQSAVLTSRVGFEPSLSGDALSNGLSPEVVAHLDQTLRTSALSEQITRIKVWGGRNRVVYSDDHAIIGRAFPPSDELQEALHGEVVSEISTLQKAENGSERQHGRLLEVYVPLRLAGSGTPAGAFELYLPYEPIAKTIDHDTRQLRLLLLIGLSLLWLALFRVVHAASRRLRHQVDENRHQALHDGLTGLPNRALFNDRVDQAIVAARRTGAGVAVMLMDLDRFKEINDTLGHHCGDLLLQQIGPRLDTRLRAVDSVSRLGGDEFAILMPGIEGVETAQAVAEEIRKVLAEAFSLDGLTVEVEASVGIALFPQDGADAATLLQRADVAMYVAKEAATGVELYTAEHDRYSRRRLSLVGDLRKAIEDDQLEIHYQPKADLRTGAVTAVEALVRWHHPTYGLLLPDEFIPLAEHTGLIRPLTLEVVRAAVTQCAAWRASGLDVGVAVNLSARNLHDLALPEEVGALLREAGLDPSRLRLEITESTIMADPIRAMEVVSRLHDLGTSLAIDDFGTGYSSLAYLKRLPVDELKIDKSFVMDMVDDDNDAVIVRSTIDLARNLGLTVVAEGVETQATWDSLVALGCDLAQGFFLSKPVPAEELTEWLHAHALGQSVSSIV